MRLLCFSDLHASIRHAERLVGMARDADVLVGAGDFGDQRADYQGCVEALRRADRPAILVPGNNESLEELRAACHDADWAEATVLHGTTAEIGGIKFFGLGGGVPTTPFGAWSWDLTEAEATTLLGGLPTAAVLVSHSPPRGAVDHASSGASLGSVAVRAAIERQHPRLVVCGHIHASAGQTALVGATPILNAGPRGHLWTLSRQS